MLTTPRDRVLAASWTAPTDGATATGYDLRHKPSSGGNSEWDETSAYVSTTSLETPDLRLVGSYDLQVRSVGAEYPGDWTATVQGTPTGSVNITAELTSLTLSGVTIADTFAGGTHSYTGSAGYATAVTTITPGLQDFQAVEYLDSSNRVLTDADDMTEGFQAALAVNENTIKVRVTAEDRVTRVTYTIVVTRAKPTVGVSAFSTADTEGASIEFLFERSVAAADALVIRFVVRESVAVLQAGSPTSVTIPADESQVTLELQTVDDQSYESNAIVAVTIESDSGYDIITGRDLASASVLDNDFPAATATLTVETPVDEGDAARVTVTITTNGDTIPHGPTGELRLTTATGTAGAEDFTDFTGGEVVTSVAGTAFLRTDINDDPDEEQWVYRYSNTWDIQTTDDDLREPNDETFNVVLAKVTSGDTPASPNIRLTSPSTRTITISPSDHASDANLSSLTLNPSAEISPELGAGGDYTASVPFNVTRITVRVTRADANGQTEWLDPADDSVLATSTSATSNRAYDLSYGENTIKIRVTAEDETTTRDYMLVITRELPVLRISTILQGTQLTESSFMIVGFAALPAAATETIRIRFRVSETTGDAIAQSVEDAPTTLSLNPPHRSVQAPFSLTNDDTWEEHATVVISVAESDHFTIGDTSGATRSVLDDDFPEATATLSLSTTTANENDMDGPNAGDTVTATVTVSTARNEEPHENGGSIRLTLGTDADDATEDASSSDYRTIGSTTLSFPRSEFTHITAGNVYRLSKTVEIKIVNDSAKERDEVFTVTMNRVTSGSGQTDSAITFDSTATTHTVTIPQSDRSSDASLQSLSLSAGGPLSPGFSAGTTEYTAAVPFGDTQITINPQRNEPNSTLTYLDGADAALADASASAGFQVDLPLNTPLVVKMRVVAEDEITERTYTLTITRQLPIVSIALPARSDLDEGDTVVATVTRNGTTDERTDFSLTIVDEFNTMTDAADVGTKSYTIAADTDSIEISVPTIDDDDWDEHSRLSMQLETGSGYSVSDSESSVSRRLIDDDFPEAIATLELRNAADTAPLTGLVPEVENSIVGVRVTIETRRNEMPHEDAGSIWLITQEGPDPDGEGRNTAATGGVDYEEFRGDTGRLFFSRSSFSEEDGVYKSTTYEEISIVDDSDDEYEERFTVRIRTRPLSSIRPTRTSRLPTRCWRRCRTGGPPTSTSTAVTWPTTRLWARLPSCPGRRTWVRWGRNSTPTPSATPAPPCPSRSRRSRSCRTREATRRRSSIWMRTT